MERFKRPRVIVVEDDPDVLAAIAATLRDEFAVWVARSGAQALELAEQLGYAADVLVVDLDLGPAMSGERFVAEYRGRAPRAPRVIVVSGVPAAYEIARAMRAAATLPKPFNADELIHTIQILAPAT